MCDSDRRKDVENNIYIIDVMENAQKIASGNPVDLSSDHCDSMWNDVRIEVENQMKKIYINLYSLFEECVTQLNTVSNRDLTDSTDTSLRARLEISSVHSVVNNNNEY